MVPNRKRTDEVLASARKELQGQLAVVREEMSRLAGEERALSAALSSLDGGSSSSRRPSRANGGTAASRSSTRRSARGRRRRTRGQSKSTADRLEELKSLLAGGAKSRNELAAELNVSPARVQQLLAELGGAVSSRPNPEQRQGKLWSLKASGGKDGSARKRPARAKQTTS